MPVGMEARKPRNGDDGRPLPEAVAERRAIDYLADLGDELGDDMDFKVLLAQVTAELRRRHARRHPPAPGPQRTGR